ncbi:hypothetical protein [Actinosynnema sp. NPDC020468]
MEVFSSHYLEPRVMTVGGAAYVASHSAPAWVDEFKVRRIVKVLVDG